MTKTDLMNMFRKYHISSSGEAERIAYGSCSMLVMPALTKFDNKDVTYIEGYEESDAGLTVCFFSPEGGNLEAVVSDYAEGDIIYIREAYYIVDGKVKYFTDFGPEDFNNRHYFISARYMPRHAARSFVKIKSVRLCRLHDLTMQDLHKLGYRSYDLYFREWDSCLSEKQWEFCRSEHNPFVFVYEVEHIDAEE